MRNGKEYYIYRLIKRLIKILAGFPRPLLVSFALPLGRIWYGLDRYHRRIAYENMIGAYGSEKSEQEIRQLVRANFVQLVRVVLESPSLMKLNRKNVHTYLEFSGREHLRAALEDGKGVLFLTAHLGNWEMMALASSVLFDLPLYVLVRPLDFKPLDRVLTEIRSRTGNRVLDKDKSAGIISQLLSDNKIIGILLDQNASWYEGVYVPFFNRIACTNKGLAMFALRYGATVIPAFNFRQADGRYRVIIEPAVELIRSGKISDDIVANTALFNRIIEKHIRMAPDNWLWVHRRWRIKDVPEKARRKIRGLPFDGL